MRRVLLIAAACTLATLAVAESPEYPLRRVRSTSHDEMCFECRPMRRKEPRLYQTKREKREMMQRDFEHGGSRLGRRRRQRMYHARNK